MEVKCLTTLARYLPDPVGLLIVSNVWNFVVLPRLSLRHRGRQSGLFPNFVIDSNWP